MFPAQALGIPFVVLGAAEKQPEYRSIIMRNHGKHLQHMFETIEDMLADQPCVLHPGQSSCRALPHGADMADGVSLGITGSPCNPFSTARCKRFADDSVQQHSMTVTTMRCVVQFYTTWEPRAGITEQVTGFDMRTSASDPTTPCDKLPYCTVCSRCGKDKSDRSQCPKRRTGSKAFHRPSGHDVQRCQLRIYQLPLVTSH